MRLYAVALVTWAATITAFSEPNVANLSDEKAVDYTEFRDLPEKRAGVEARSFEQKIEDHHPNVGLRRSGDEKDSIGVSSTPEAIYATPVAETIDEYPFQQRSRESRYAGPEEDVLLVENAGSFGQKVRQDYQRGSSGPRQNDGYASFRKSHVVSDSTVLPLRDDDGRSYVTVTSEPYVFALKKEGDEIPQFSSEVIESKVAEEKKSKQVFDFVERATEESLPSTEVASSILGENDVVPEDPQPPRIRSSRAYENDTAADDALEGSVKKSVRVSSSTSVEISPSLQPVKFSGPIVVADLAGKETPETMVDYPDDLPEALSFRSVENAEITPDSYVEGSKASIPSNEGDIATSSIMLSPLQVGIALMNADETGSTGDNEESAATDNKDYLHQNELQRLSTMDKKLIASNVENRSRADYKDEREEEKTSVEAVPQKVPDNSVEIQKSVEIFHTAPVHEIHYPPVYIQQTSNLGVIESNNIGRVNQPYAGQDEQSESQTNYDVYRGNEPNFERSVIKTQASEQMKLTRQRYNALEDDVSKPTASAVIAEYSSSSGEQTPVESQAYNYNDVNQVLLVPNQFDDTLYDQADVRHLKDNVSAHAAKVLTYGNAARQESASESSRFDQQQQPINDHQFRTSEVRRPEVQQLLLKIIPEGSGNEGFVVPIPRPYPIEKIIEKTVHVPHPIEIERKVPYPVERMVEKRIQMPATVPQMYPVHVQVPMVEKQTIRLPQVYPIHVIERRVPYTVQRLLVQPAPSYQSLQLRLQPTSTTQEKLAVPSRSSAASRPYRADAERPADLIDSSNKMNDVPVKYRHKSSTSGKPLRDSAAFELQNEANTSRFYGSIPPYGRPFTYNIDVGKGYVPFTDVKLMILPRKYNSHVVLRPQQQTIPLRPQIVYNLVERNKDDDYLGPTPPRKISSSKSPSSFSSSSTTTAALRRSRHPDTQYPGSFRQSKMEYGFKPPMVPSVQYDELTATQVEN